MPDKTIWLGELRKGDEPGTVVGFLKDSWGWSVAIRGVRQEDGSYKLDGTLADPPDSLRIAAIDGEKKPT